MRRTFTLRKQGLLCICDSKDFKGIWKLFVGSCHSVEKRNMCMYKFIVRRSRSWVICLVWKVEMFLPADVLARCSWHRSGLCSVYCLIGKVLPHLQKQAIRKLVVINVSSNWPNERAKHIQRPHGVLEFSFSDVGGEGLIGSSVQSPERSRCSLWESFLYFFSSFFLPFCKAHRWTLRSCAAESVQIQRANYKTGRKSWVWLWNAGRSADATTRERNMTFFLSFFLLFLITNRSDGVKVEKVAQCFSATPWKTLRQSAE